jgi:dinuclear metal center YbgI/SA1388 family protein
VSARAPLRDIVVWLDGLLRVAEIPDYPGALNGLQVENGGVVTRIVAAVDASLQTIAGAGRGDLILVHHGLFWDGNQPVIGRRYRRMKALFSLDAALYAAHLPLDLHPEIGNNVLLAQGLGVPVEGWFGRYQGTPIGVWGRRQCTRDELVSQVGTLLGGAPVLVPGGPARVERVGIVSGAGGGMVAEARAAGCDTLITGEGAHHTYFDATELGVNLIYAGHYATETVGVRAFAERAVVRFGLPWEFHDHPTGL